MINLHTHTRFSDGLHSPEALVKSARRHKLTVLGINDHYKTLKCPDRSLDPTQCEVYIAALERLRERVRDRLELKIGLEVDFSAERTDFTSFPWELTEKLDYLLLEYIEDDAWAGLSLRDVKLIRKRLDCPVGMAHNDLALNFTPRRYAELLDVLEEHEIFLELSPTLRNCRGITPYYYFAEDFFLQARGRSIFFSIGTDTHTDLNELGDIQNAWDFLVQLGLQDQILFLTPQKSPR